MTEMDDGKFVRQSISLPPTLLTRLRETTSNSSAYIRTLIENDLDGRVPEPKALSSTIIVDLARVLSGEIDAQIIAKKLAGADQPMMLRAWLRNLAETEEVEVDEAEEGHLDIRGEAKRQESPVRRIMRESMERNQHRGTMSS